jgi:integrase
MPRSANSWRRCASKRTPPAALELAILTAARTGEMIGATWGEIDLARKVWTISASRMKAGKEHRVPLSARALCGSNLT